MFSKTIILVVIGSILSVNAQSKSNCTAGPPRMDLKDCCTKAKILDENVFRGCFTKISSSSGNEAAKELVKSAKNGKHNGLRSPNSGEECVLQCILNATKSLINGELDTKKAIAFVTTALSNNKDWIPTVTAGIKYCSRLANAKKNDFTARLNGVTPDGTYVCSPYSAFLLGCMHSYEFANCPDAKFKKSDQNCLKAKKFFSDCPTPPIL